MVLKRPAMNRIRGRGQPDIFVVIIAKKHGRRVEDGVKERKTIGPQKPAREMSTLHQTAICLPISLSSSVSISLFYSCVSSFFLSSAGVLSISSISHRLQKLWFFSFLVSSFLLLREMPLARYENSMGNRSLSPWQRSELYYCMMRSTVVIDCKIVRDVIDEGRTVIDTRRGGGVILNEQGLILTSLRLVHEVSSISATLSDMTTTYEATLVFDIVNSDLALIKISELEVGQRLMYAQISPQVLDVGQEVLSIGSSYQLPPFQCSHSYANELVTFGTQNVLNEEVNWSAHDFPEMIYMIGSPVYDSSGKIVALQQGHNSHHAIGLPGEKLLEFYLAYNG